MTENTKTAKKRIHVKGEHFQYTFVTDEPEGELPTIERKIEIKGKMVNIKGQVYRDDKGYCRVSFEYWPDGSSPPSSHSYDFGTSAKINKSDGISKKADLPLNGPGRRKMEKKVVRHVYSQVLPRLQQTYK